MHLQAGGAHEFVGVHLAATGAPQAQAAVTTDKATAGGRVFKFLSGMASGVVKSIKSVAQNIFSKLGIGSSSKQTEFKACGQQQLPPKMEGLSQQTTKVAAHTPISLGFKQELTPEHAPLSQLPPKPQVENFTSFATHDYAQPPPDAEPQINQNNFMQTTPDIQEMPESSEEETTHQTCLSEEELYKLTVNLNVGVMSHQDALQKAKAAFAETQKPTVMYFIAENGTAHFVTVSKDVELVTGVYPEGVREIRNSFDTQVITKGGVVSMASIRFNDLAEKSQHLDFAMNPDHTIARGADSQVQRYEGRRNLERNRYLDIIPADSNLVSKGKDYYYNASQIDINDTSYVQAQGPRDEYDAACMFKAALDENVTTIACMTRDIEAGSSKCFAYWDEESLAAINQHLNKSGINISKGEETFDAESGMMVRQFFVTDQNNFGNPPKTITQLHYTGWPDKGVPEDGAFEKLVYTTNKIHKETGEGGKLMCQCSAGVGRSGTLLLGCYAATHPDEFRGEDGSELLDKHILNAREQRGSPLVIQKPEQYELLLKFATKL